MKKLPTIFRRKGTAALDLTVGSPLKRILTFMLPMLIGNIFNQLYSMVDTVIVGQTLGSDALAGVGSTGAITFLILGFVSGLTHGFSVVVSQRRGAHDEEGMRKSFATGIALTVVIVSVLTVIALAVTKPLLTAMHTQPDFYPYAYQYLSVIFGGMLLSALSNQFASTLRAIGDSLIPLFFLVFSCVFNASFDCLFIMVFDMGVSGAAAATVLANGISALSVFTYIWIKYPMLRFKPKHFRPNLKRYATHLKLGVPMALQMSVISIGMIVGQTALNAMSPTEIKAYVTATKIDGLATSVLNTAGIATATFVGQNYGAKRYDRIKKGVKQYTVFMIIVSLALGATAIALHRPLVMLFISRAERSEALYAGALKYLVFNAGFYILLATLCITRSGLQGMGRGTLALTAAMAEVVMRVGVALIAMHYQSYTIVCMLNCMSWIGANIMLFPAFLATLRKYVPLFKPHAKFLHLPNPSEIPFTQPKEED